jgi:hypothetical protein
MAAMNDWIPGRNALQPVPTWYLRSLALLKVLPRPQPVHLSEAFQKATDLGRSKDYAIRLYGYAIRSPLIPDPNWTIFKSLCMRSSTSNLVGISKR